MREAASELLVERAREGDGLRRTLLGSSAAHLFVIATLLLAPADWFSRPAEETLDVMTLRLGGPEGPGVGGRTALGGRPVQEVVTLPEARRPQWIQPPAPAPPRMVLPVPEEVTRRRPEPETEVPTVPEEARGRRLTTGPEEVLGSTMADTGVQGIGIGLSGGGLGGSGGEVAIEDFCCPEYLATMLDLIRRRWDRHQRVTGTVIVRFEIGRSGRIDAVTVDRGSGYLALDLAAQRAVLLTRQIQPLPERFGQDTLNVRLTFEYRP
ncbi:MAG: TonB family protein [Acidobacteria bacterium]|nr:TonB family protein [Acidobacteriota bacterium]